MSTASWCDHTRLPSSSKTRRRRRRLSEHSQTAPRAARSSDVTADCRSLRSEAHHLSMTKPSIDTPIIFGEWDSADEIDLSESDDGTDPALEAEIRAAQAVARA